MSTQPFSVVASRQSSRHDRRRFRLLPDNSCIRHEPYPHGDVETVFRSSYRASLGELRLSLVCRRSLGVRRRMYLGGRRVSLGGHCGVETVFRCSTSAYQSSTPPAATAAAAGLERPVKDHTAADGGTHRRRHRAGWSVPGAQQGLGGRL